MTISYAILAPSYESSYYLVIFSSLIVIMLAYVTTKFLAKSRHGASRGRNMQVVERLYLSADKHLLIVKVGDDYFLMSQDKSGVRLVNKLDEFTPELNEDKSMKFSDILDKFSNNKDK